MSWFSAAKTVDPSAPTFHPVAYSAEKPTDSVTSDDIFGPLSDSDTDWVCETNKGFITETQNFYSVLSDGSWIMLQIIFSNTGIMFVPPQIQYVYKRWDPKTNDVLWKSINITNFVADGKNIKSDQVTIKHTGSATTGETYTINASLAADLQISVTMVRPADVPGFKVGKGEKGGMSFYGPAAASEGFVVHRFLPVLTSSGLIMQKGKAITADGEATFVHAVQGMRPNLTARRWNYAYFAAPSTRAIMMELTTNDEHGVEGKGKGRNKVNVGCLVIDGKLTVITNETVIPGRTSSSPMVSKATHFDPINDADTGGYPAPTRIDFEWSGPALGSKEVYKADLSVPVGITQGEKGLIEKINVLAEIPYLVRKVVIVVASTNPYIYQYFNPATLTLTAPGQEPKPIPGHLFNEATFITE